MSATYLPRLNHTTQKTMKENHTHLLVGLITSLVLGLCPASASPVEYFPFGASDPFDLANSTVLFTPNGSSYDVCIDPAFNYPVNPD